MEEKQSDDWESVPLKEKVYVWTWLVGQLGIGLGMWIAVIFVGFFAVFFVLNLLPNTSSTSPQFERSNCISPRVGC